MILGWNKKKTLSFERQILIADAAAIGWLYYRSQSHIRDFPKCFVL